MTRAKARPRGVFGPRKAVAATGGESPVDHTRYGWRIRRFRMADPKDASIRSHDGRHNVRM